MITLTWILSILAILVAQIRTGASLDKDVEPLRCYTTCTHINNTSDCQPLDELTQEKCTPELPYCGTIAKSPDYVSSLACTAGNQTPCTLIQTTKETYEMTCTCDRHLCNKPFTREFRNELLNFSSTNLPDNTTRGLVHTFINSTVFANITSANLYEAITLKMVKKTPKLTTVSPKPVPSNSVSTNAFNNANAPRAEALKYETVVPSDDDEDEGEGSGSFTIVKPQAPAAPAAPSSFLPANENMANAVHINLLATIPFVYLFIVA